MKKLWIIVSATLFLAGCTEKKMERQSLSYSFPDVLTIDSANKMLGSYLNSINYSQNDTDLQSISINAALLRNLLDTVSTGHNISKLKIMFAHTLSYINAGHANQRAGYKSGALTLIIAGYDTSGNYIYLSTKLVIDNGMACPTNCPPGPAASGLLPVSN